MSLIKAYIIFKWIDRTRSRLLGQGYVDSRADKLAVDSGSMVGFLGYFAIAIFHRNIELSFDNQFILFPSNNSSTDTSLLYLLTVSFYFTIRFQRNDKIKNPLTQHKTT